jgi:transposase InsO family protein
VDLSRLPAYQRYQRHDRKWKRYEKPLPGHAVQVDVKFIAPLSSSSRKKYYQFTAINDCTRIRVLRIYDQLNQKTAIQFADYVLDKLPFRVEAIQTDGSEFQTAFHWHLADRGIRHIYIKPATPRLNGKVERSHPSTARSSTASSSASSSTTHSCSTINSKNGRTTTTTIGRTAPSAARPSTNASDRRQPHGPPSKRSTSVLQRGGGRESNPPSRHSRLRRF